MTGFRKFARDAAALGFDAKTILRAATKDDDLKTGGAMKERDLAP